MKIRYIAESIPLALEKGKIYELLGFEKGPDLISGKGDVDWARIMTDIGEDYLFLLTEGEDYEIVEE